jgi:hypothetical protein
VVYGCNSWVVTDLKLKGPSSKTDSQVLQSSTKYATQPAYLWIIPQEYDA